MGSAMPDSASALPDAGASEGSLAERRWRVLTMRSGVALESGSETPMEGGRISWRSETEKIPPSLICESAERRKETELKEGLLSSNSPMILSSFSVLVWRRYWSSPSSLRHVRMI